MVDDRISVGVLGATGAVGRKLVELLANHPWFRLSEACGSPSSSGKALARSDSGEGDASSAGADHLRLKDPDSPWESPILLSALPASAAREQEIRLAEAGHVVVSNASVHRMRPDVPLIVPEVNGQHLELVTGQAWDGALVTNPNCAVAGLALALAPLHEVFGVERVVTTSLQAISGAGTPGPSAGSLLDNVLPLIPGEEEKFTGEPQKILGRIEGGVLAPADFPGECLLYPRFGFGRPSAVGVGGVVRPAAAGGGHEGHGGVPGLERFHESSECAEEAVGGHDGRGPSPAPTRPRPRRGNDSDGR